MQIKISDKITLVLTEQGFTYSNWLYINDEVQTVIETGMDEDGLQGFDPTPIDAMACASHHRIQGLPEIDVFYGLPRGGAPVLGFPARQPFFKNLRL